MTQLPQPFDVDAAVFPVSVAAQLAGMHSQTLRGYDRLGLVVPQRTRGRGRRYSLRDIAKLRHIQHLSQEQGINLEGIRRILELEEEIDGLRAQIDRLGEALTRIQGGGGYARVFTGDTHGDVHHGRYQEPRRRQLGWR